MIRETIDQKCQNEMWFRFIQPMMLGQFGWKVRGLRGEWAFFKMEDQDRAYHYANRVETECKSVKVRPRIELILPKAFREIL